MTMSCHEANGVERMSLFCSNEIGSKGRRSRIENAMDSAGNSPIMYITALAETPELKRGKTRKKSTYGLAPKAKPTTHTPNARNNPPARLATQSAISPLRIVPLAKPTPKS